MRTRTIASATLHRRGAVRRETGRRWSERPARAHQPTWSEKALDPGEPAWLIDYRRYLDRVEKVKREEGGNIILEGGPAVVRECLRRNLADDYWFFVMLVVTGRVLGTGVRWTVRRR